MSADDLDLELDRHEYRRKLEVCLDCGEVTLSVDPEKAGDLVCALTYNGDDDDRPPPAKIHRGRVGRERRERYELRHVPSRCRMWDTYDTIYKLRGL